jgi:hypothetical protein
VKVSVNILCLCAAALGLVALLLPWWVTTSTHYLSEDVVGVWERDSADLVRFIPDGTSGEMALALGACLFAMGVALCVWTPIGGVLQAGGIATYLVMGYTTVFGTEEGRQIIVDEPGLGAVVALAAAAIAVVSLLVRPVRVGTKQEGHGTGSRLLAWSISRDLPAKVASDS